MVLFRRLACAPVACLAFVCFGATACEQPPEVTPLDAGARDAFPWEDAAPQRDVGGSADAAADVGPADGGPQDGGAVPLPYSIVVLPDTQYYASDFPAFFDAQTAWIVGEHATGNIAFVLHEGDIVDDDVAPQWMRATHSLHMLDGVVPYVLSAGNHDYCCGGWPTDRSSTMINAYFPVAIFQTSPSFKETFEPDHIENSAHLFDVPGGA